MSIEEIKKIAELSKLDFSDEELASFSLEFESMDKIIEKVQAVKCEVEYKIPVVEYDQLSEDVVAPSYSREEVLKNAPRKDSISFILPKVVE